MSAACAMMRMILFFPVNGCRIDTRMVCANESNKPDNTTLLAFMHGSITAM